MLASFHWFTVAEETQPARSVRAEARPTRPAERRTGRVKVFMVTVCG